MFSSKFWRIWLLAFSSVWCEWRPSITFLICSHACIEQLTSMWVTTLNVLSAVDVCSTCFECRVNTESLKCQRVLYRPVLGNGRGMVFNHLLPSYHMELLPVHSSTLYKFTLCCKLIILHMMFLLCAINCVKSACMLIFSKFVYIQICTYGRTSRLNSCVLHIIVCSYVRAVCYTNCYWCSALPCFGFV